MEFDEINKLYKPRSIPYDKYFGDMELTGDQIRERISFSEDTEDTLLFILVLLGLLGDYGVPDDERVKQTIETLTIEFRGVVERYTAIDDYLENYVSEFADGFVTTTIENIDDAWYTSNDRAMFDSENEANTVLNYKDYLGAISQGYTQKEWRTFRDNRVRKTHKAVDGKTIGIKDVFLVGDSMMRFAKDTSLGAKPQEIINCRCVTHFIK